MEGADCPDTHVSKVGRAIPSCRPWDALPWSRRRVGIAVAVAVAVSVVVVVVVIVVVVVVVVVDDDVVGDVVVDVVDAVAVVDVVDVVVVVVVVVVVLVVVVPHKPACIGNALTQQNSLKMFHGDVSFQIGSVSSLL